MKNLSYLFLAVFFTGCVSGTKEIGRVGDTTYYSVRHQSFSGPNLSVIVSKRDCEDSPVSVTSAGGAGIGTSVIGGAAVVGGAAVFGGAIRPSRTSVSTSTSADGGSFVPPGHINNPSANH